MLWMYSENSCVNDHINIYNKYILLWWLYLAIKQYTMCDDILYCFGVSDFVVVECGVDGFRWEYLESLLRLSSGQSRGVLWGCQVGSLMASNKGNKP